MADAFEHVPPPIPNLAKLWLAWEKKSISGENKTLEGTPALAQNSPSGADDPKGSVEAKDTPTTLLRLKLAVFKDVMSYSSHGQDRHLLAAVKQPNVEKFALDHRIKRALEGKDAANAYVINLHRLNEHGRDVAAHGRKYKAGNWPSAMFTYAVAWVMLLPYYPDMEAEGLGAEDLKELGKVEAALFSNISATALMQLKSTPDPEAPTSGSSNSSTTPAANSSHRDETHSTTDNEDTTPDLPPSELSRLLAQIGLDASEVCISLAGYITVGSMSKSCRRAGEFCEKSKDRYIPPDKVRFFKEQEELLKGLDEKGMFADVPRDKIAKPARV